MEETNYDRAPLEMFSTPSDTPGTTTPKEQVLSTSSDPEKTTAVANSDSNNDQATDTVHYKPKAYVQKLALLDKKRDFHLFRMMIRPLLFLSLPSVVYAGFSYGSNLVWFNVLNGTASLSMYYQKILSFVNIHHFVCTERTFEVEATSCLDLSSRLKDC
jgi:hypothetical protein